MPVVKRLQERYLFYFGYVIFKLMSRKGEILKGLNSMKILWSEIKGGIPNCRKRFMAVIFAMGVCIKPGVPIIVEPCW